MPGFLLSVTTVRTHKQYGIPDFRTVEQRDPTREDAMAPVAWPPMHEGRLAGPCGAVVDGQCASQEVFYHLLSLIAHYVHTWGHQPLGGRLRAQGAQHYSSST